MSKAIQVPARVVLPKNLLFLIDARARALALSRDEYLRFLVREDLRSPAEASPAAKLTNVELTRCCYENLGTAWR